MRYLGEVRRPAARGVVAWFVIVLVATPPPDLESSRRDPPPRVGDRRVDPLTGEVGSEAPVGEAEWRCPVAPRATIVQGNGGLLSHQDAFNRYAFDYDVPTGTAVVAARTGVVRKVYAWSSIGGPDRSFIPDENVVELDHGDGRVSRYVHLRRGWAPEVGEVVLQGERIGYSGATGWVVGPHLHLVVMENGVSAPIAFGDFPDRGGVPREGDAHGPPAPPRVPQAAIDRYKATLRALRSAAAGEHPDIALALADECLLELSHDDYVYHRAVVARRDVAAAAVNAVIDDIVAAAALTEEDACVMHRFKESLSGVKAMKPRLRELRAQAGKQDAEVRRAASVTAPEVRRLVEGLREAANGSLVGAAGSFSRMRRPPAVFREAAVRAVRGLLEREADLYRLQAARLKDEAARCPAACRDEVSRVASDLASDLRRALDVTEAAFPELAADVEPLRRSVDADEREIAAAFAAR